MKRLGWLTDIHLNFLEPEGREAFLARLVAERLDGLLLCGDVGEAPTVRGFLETMAKRLGIAIYFVLGNHDFYSGDIDGVRGQIRAACAASPHLKWLTEGAVVPLSASTALVGHDGWADGRFGNYERSEVVLSDFYLIADLARLDRPARLRKLHELGDAAATYFEVLLPEVVEAYENVLLLTHVPPFQEACGREAKSSDDYLPYYSSRALGEVLMRIMEKRPDRHLTVLCGHTHSANVATILDNLVVRTGGAQYGEPALQDILSIETN